MIQSREYNLYQKSFFSQGYFWRKQLLCWSLAFVCLLGIAYQAALAQGSTVKIAVAANLLLPMQEVKKLYEEKYNEKLILIPGSSGKLTAQILNGAPYDIFLSADMKYPRQIVEEGHAAQEPEVLLRGRLVLWSKYEINDKPEEFLQKNKQIRSIAIAQPELAPYGRRAKDWLDEHKIYESVSPKIIFGESIGQVNQYIRSGTVEAAFTAISAMQAEEIKDFGYWKPLTVYSGDPSRLDHGLVLLSNAVADKKAIRQFLEFVHSTDIKQLFIDFGYEFP